MSHDITMIFRVDIWKLPGHAGVRWKFDPVTRVFAENLTRSRCSLKIWPGHGVRRKFSKDSIVVPVDEPALRESWWAGAARVWANERVRRTGADADDPMLLTEGFWGWLSRFKLIRLRRISFGDVRGWIGGGMGGGMGWWMDTYIYIACLRLVVAFAPNVIKCAVGAIKGNKMRRLRRRTREGVEGEGGFMKLMK